jgi:hypothetical protein
MDESSMTGFEIVPIARGHIPSFHAAVDMVAREKKYLTFLGAPLLEETTKFVLARSGAGDPECGRWRGTPRLSSAGRL